MATPPAANAVVSTVRGFDPPLDRPATELLQADRGLLVELETGQRIALDAADPRSIGFAQILDGLRRQRLPVYLELDPETSAITRLLIPHVARVVGFEPTEGGLGVELEPSHARHVLRRDAPGFDELEGKLREALRTREPLIVTEDDSHEIIDVRDFTPDPEGPPIPFPEPRFPPRLLWPWRWIRILLRWIWWWPWWPWWWFRCISSSKAQQVFDAMKATSCSPLTVPPPCIPFLYPDDGCWARAHEMCRLMIDTGLSPKKVWIEGNLRVDTKNNPVCFVKWGWHVAPTLCVRGPGIFLRRDMVIDPSLFDTPVSKATWKGVQSDPNATLTDTDASIYWLWTNGTDPAYADTNYYLNVYRLKLQARAVQQGPPPYANCP